MHYQKLIVNMTKYARAYTTLNYIAENVRHSNSWRNKFANRLLQISTTKRHRYNDNHKFHRQKMTNMFVVSNGIFYALLDFFKSDEERIPELIMTIKRSILLIQKGEFKAAERMLHIALKEAQTLQHYDAITYIYDVMANLAFDTGNYKNAEELFVSVLQRLLSTGTAKDDLKVIHISLKIAKLFEETNDMEKAEDGYKFCLENLQNHIAKGNENNDVIILLGMTSDWYAQMLFKQSRYTESLKYYSQAYDLYAKSNFENNEQAVVLLNDLGTVSYMLEQYDKAIEYLSTAMEIAKELPEMVDVASVYINMGNVFIKKKLHEEATKYCKKGWELAKQQNDKDSLNEAKICLEEIRKMMA